jgi:hypothetical protein
MAGDRDWGREGACVCVSGGGRGCLEPGDDGKNGEVELFGRLDDLNALDQLHRRACQAAQMHEVDCLFHAAGSLTILQIASLTSSACLECIY